MSGLQRDLLLEILSHRLESLPESGIPVKDLIMGLAQETFTDADLLHLIELDDQTLAEEIFGFVSQFASQVMTEMYSDEAPSDIGAILAKAAMLSAQGDRKEAISLLESRIELNTSDYSDVKKLRKTLEAAAESMAPEDYFMMITALASFHSLEGHYSIPITLLEADTGIESGDYSNPHAVLSKIYKRVDGFPSEALLMYLQLFVGALGVSRRHSIAVDLFEAYMGLTPEDYNDAKKLRGKLDLQFPEKNADLRAAMISTLAASYEIVGRNSEATKITMANLGIDDISKETDDSLREKISPLFKYVQPDAAAFSAQSLALWLSTQGYDRAGIIALEEFIELEKGDYSSKDRLTEKISLSLTRTVTIDTGLSVIITLGGLLAHNDRPADALALLERPLDIDRSDYSSVTNLSEKFASFKENLAPDIGATYMRGFMETLALLERYADAVTVISADLNLEPSDFLDEKIMAARLSTRLNVLGIDTAPAYLFSLVYIFESAGYVREASAAVDWYLNDYVNINSNYETGIAALTHNCPLLDRWFTYLGISNRDRALRMCNQTVQYLRYGFDEVGVTLEDRIEFINYVSLVRKNVLKTGYYWATVEPDKNRARAIHLDVQLWDAELGQRILFEKFLFKRIVSVEGSVDFPTEGWPFRKSKEVELINFLPKFKPIHRIITWPMLARPFGFQGGADAKIDVSTPAQPMEEQDSPPWIDRAKEIMRSAETRKLLNHAFGDGFLLIRATFLDDGSIVWAALSGKGEDLSVEAFDRTDSGALQKIRFATALHDVQMNLIWLNYSGDNFVDNITPFLQEVADLLERIESMLASGDASASESISQLPSRFVELFETLNRESLLYNEQGILLRYVETLYIACNPLTQLPANTDQYAGWIAQARDYWKSIYDLFLKFDVTEMTVELRPALDGATKQYTEAVSSVWPLDALVPLLSQDIDVVLQLDDVLHGVPIANLLIAGKPLYQRVRSLRSSLSVLLAMLQRDIEEEYPPLSNGPRQMLVLSGFEDEGAKNAAMYLHEGHKALAGEYGLSYYAAADNPKASPGIVKRALDELGSLSLLSVCGHGSRYQAGVWLHDKIWAGGGCDLSRIEWLLMVSCSIGRLEQTGDLDVEGFCVELALHRSRSALACRWPVHGFEAISFANEVVHQYLNLLKEGETDKSCARARALNLARNVFLNPSPGQDMDKYVGLNTAGAFELYGIG